MGLNAVTILDALLASLCLFYESDSCMALPLYLRISVKAALD